MPAIHEIATLTSKGQVTLPKSVRQILGVDKGGKIAFDVRGGGGGRRGPPRTHPSRSLPFCGVPSVSPPPRGGGGGGPAPKSWSAPQKPLTKTLPSVRSWVCWRLISEAPATSPLCRKTWRKPCSPTQTSL